MLSLDGEAFTTGRSGFLDHAPGGRREATSKIYVKIGLQGIPPVLAQLDTGAAWSVLEPEIAEALGLFDGSGPEVALHTPLGRHHGRLEEVPLTLLADEGHALEVAATVFVCRDWPGATFLGYSGLLAHVRFALDPQDRNFYFGSYGEE